MSAWQKAWQPIEARLEVCSLREKMLILVVIGVVLYLLFEAVAFKPLWHQISVKQTLVQNQTQALDEIRQLLQQSKDNQAANQAEIEQDISDYQDKLNQTNKSTFYGLSAKEMLFVLEAVLKTHPEVQLLDFQNQAVESIDEGHLLYAHPVELRLNGTYYSLLQFMRRIEALGLPLQWTHLQYQVAEHPQAQLHLKLKLITQTKPFIEF